MTSKPVASEEVQLGSTRAAQIPAILIMQIGGSASNCEFCSPDGRAKPAIGFKMRIAAQIHARLLLLVVFISESFLVQTLTGYSLRNRSRKL